MPRRERRGTGITAHEVLVFELDDPADHEAFVQWPLVTFAQSLNHNEAAARAFLRRKEIGADDSEMIRTALLHADDSPIGVAGRVLEVIRDLRMALTGSDASKVASLGMRLGALIARDLMKRQWEKPALRGKRSGDQARENAAQRRENQKRDAEEWHQKARTEAERIRREEKPYASKADIARYVKKRLKLTVASKTIEPFVPPKK